MRLIDADEFKEIIVTYNKAGFATLCINKICELIDGQSTAYDVDKVVERLEQKRDTVTRSIALNSQDDDVDSEILREISHYQEIIKIVKSGGIE